MTFSLPDGKDLKGAEERLGGGGGSGETDEIEMVTSCAERWH